MLVVTRREDERIFIVGPDKNIIEITLVRSRYKQARIGIQADRNKFKIVRDDAKRTTDAKN